MRGETVRGETIGVRLWERDYGSEIMGVRSRRLPAVPHLFGLPHFQHRHASDDGVGVLLSGGVDGVVGTDDQHQVRVWKQGHGTLERSHGNIIQDT